MAASGVQAALSGNPVFAALPARERDALRAVSHEEQFRAREHIFLEGDPARFLWIVHQGRVRIFRQSRTGRDVVLELLGPGEIFGAVAVIEHRPYPAAAQATEATSAVRIPAEAVRGLAERHPSVIREMALMIGRRLRTAHDTVKALAADPVEARLAATLLRLAEREGTRTRGGLALPFHLTRQGLADMAGTTVETTIRVMTRWTREGLLAETDGPPVLADVAGLRALAEGDVSTA